MASPKRQHFVPQFYLRRWCVDGKCVVYRKFGEQISVLQKPPISIGFEKDLYTNHHAEDDGKKYEMETKVLRRVDNDASDALRHLEKNSGIEMPKRLRDGWARFLMSLLHRAPDRVETLRKAVADKSREIAAELREKYPEYAKLPDHQIMTDADSAELHQNLLKMLIDSQNIGQHLINMHWRYVRTDKLPHGFISGDRPLIRSNGIGRIDGFLLLPTGPFSFFIAVGDPRTAKAFESQTPRDLERGINDAIIKQSGKFIVSNSEIQTKFISRRLLDKKPIQRDALGDVTWNSPLKFDPWEFSGSKPMPWL